MTRWLSLGLVLVCSSAFAQTADVISEVVDGHAQLVRRNPFGGGQVAVPQVMVAAQPAKVPLPPPIPPGPNGSSLPRRPIRPGLVPAGPVKHDQHGDPLPAGAVARYGTIRLRHGTEPIGLAFSPDGKVLGSIAATEDGIRLWDPATGKELHRLHVPVSFAAFARDGSIVLVDDVRCKVWIPVSNSLRELPEKTLPENVQAIAIHPDCRSFVAGVPHKVVQIDLQTGKHVRDLKCPGDQIPTRIVFSQDGRWLAASGQKTGVWLWDLRTGKRVRTYRTEFDTPEYCFSQDGTRIAIAGENLRVFPTDSEEPVEDYKAPEGVFQQPRFSGDGKWVYAVTPTGQLAQINAATGEAKEPLDSPDAALRPPMAISSEAAFAAAVDQSGGIRIWDPRTGKGPETERLPQLTDPGFSPDGKTAWCLGANGQVHSFDPATGKRIKMIELTVDENSPLSWDPTSRRVLAQAPGEEGEIQLIDVDTNRVILKLMPPALAGGFPFGSFCASDRTRLALFGQGTVVVVNATTGKTIRTFTLGKAEESQPLRGAISPDGRLVAITTHPLSLWEVSTGKRRMDFDGVANPVGAIFSRDGRYLAGWDGLDHLAVYDLRLGTLVRKIQTDAAEGNGGLAVAFSPDGKRLAAGERGGSITVWDLGAGDAVASFERHEGVVSGLAFSPDGTRLASTSEDGTVLVWEIGTRPAAPAPEVAIAGNDEAFRLLASPEPANAQRGMEFLYRRPAEAIRLCTERIAIPPAAPAERIAKLIRDLESDDFPVRQAALKDLEIIGGEAIAALRLAAEKSNHPEVRKLASEALAKIESLPLTSDDYRILRAVELLEAIGSPNARTLLAKWSAAPQGLRLTNEAAAALARLKER